MSPDAPFGKLLLTPVGHSTFSEVPPCAREDSRMAAYGGYLAAAGRAGALGTIPALVFRA